MSNRVLKPGQLRVVRGRYAEGPTRIRDVLGARPVHTKRRFSDNGVGSKIWGRVFEQHVGTLELGVQLMQEAAHASNSNGAHIDVVADQAATPRAFRPSPNERLSNPACGVIDEALGRRREVRKEF